MPPSKLQIQLVAAHQRNRELLSKIELSEQPLRAQINALTAARDRLQADNDRLERELRYASEAYENIVMLSMARSGKLR